MQLLQIKITGFKSFVDPTPIDLPGKLIAIVGPNGCGKSNIIDAVTWVMGESSPKYLRGENSTDVIFNGSTERKPVGQASVELVFDNSDGTLGGEYARFAEVSVKRVINRDSDSSYYLNGVRCRKRDVMDLFLGTGLGPRSYSIIGQNMISRIVEAKPDELRTYLEEAAGISKYKERRHETELRIGHTKENLARVLDVCGELDKQLSHLKHQATVAEKFKTLKQQERVIRAEWYGIQWRHLDSKMVDYTLQIQREETALEARRSELSGTEREIEQLRHEQRVAHDAFQEVQRRYYAVGNEITRVEQDILHHQERQQQWEHDLKQAEHDWSNVKDEMTETEDELRDLEYELQQVEPQFNSASQSSGTVKNQLFAAEEAMLEWQNRWEEFNQKNAKTAQTAQVEKTRVEHLEQKIMLLKRRQEQLQQEQGRVNFSELNKEVEEFSQKSYEVSDQLESKGNQLQDFRKTLTTLQAAQQESLKNRDNLHGELQRMRGQQASLEALQQTALGKRNNPTTAWVTQYNLATKPRLAQNIEVEKGWEFAVEKVLGFCLQAICVDDVKEVVPHLSALSSGNICVIKPEKRAHDALNKKNAVSLLTKIKSHFPVDSLIAGIYVADDVESALKLCETLEPHESVVTRDGVWLNRSWLKILREEDPAAGVFQREQELKHLSARIDELEATLDEAENSIANRNQEIKMLEQQRDEVQEMYNQHNSQVMQINAQLKAKQERLLELKSQSERFTAEQNQSTHELNEGQSELTHARELWEGAMTMMEKEAEQRDGLIKERDAARQQLQNLREQANKEKEHIHALEIRVQTSKSRKSSLQQAMSRLQTQLSTLTERKITLQSELTSMPPMDTLKKSLSRSLDKHVSVEVELNTARVAMDSLDQEFRSLEERRQLIERDANKIRTMLETLRVELQGWKVKSDTLLEQLKETEFTIENILKDLPQDVSADEWQGKLEQIVQRIARLGPINLVAIDEYATCSERKQYLDKQVEDLQAGLVTLEDAIAKIDKETRMRFKETFDLVNLRFQELFPTVFGGGKAYLELNSDNLLEAGVTMMACPPGKRNSTIHLLSGGEKSLTAIALIFSIFHLNPAPFCLLDEVDAALDDANVSRFTRLVKTMANKTQFLFISHNKITIEMGEHLMGVTMNEPGVSRLVSVDIDKAIALAGE